MKKTILYAMICVATLTMISCGDTQDNNTHKHEDGSTHTNHDTTKPVQEQFKVTDTTSQTPTEGEHTHGDGKPHSH